jgi:plasmid stabilization system protein ParE
MHVRIMPAALREIEAIGDYIAKDNPSRAVSFISEIYESRHGLSEYAERFPVIPRYADFAVRRRPHDPYLIFYRIRSGEVEVLRVVHGARDLRKLLLPD